MKRKALLCMLLTALLLISVMSGCTSGKLAGRIGDREVKVYQLENLFTQYQSYAATYYGYDVTTEEGLNGFQDYLLNALLNSETQVYMAEQAGVTLTDEEKAEAKANAETAFNEFYEEHLTAAKNAGAADAAAYANQLLTDTLEANKTTLSGYKKTLLTAEENSIRVNKYLDTLRAESTPTEEEIQAQYDEKVAAQKEAFATTASMYYTYLMYSQYGYMDAPVYIPEGMFYVRHILVTEKTTAEQVLIKINAGQDFEMLLAEYNTDPGMSSEEYADGYLMGEGADLMYRAEFVTAALALEKEGDVSEIVETEDGFHIIKRMKDAVAGPIEMTEAEHDSIQSAVETEYINGKIEEAMQQAERFPDNYRYIGRSALVAATPEPTADPSATADPAATDDAAAATAAGTGN